MWQSRHLPARGYCERRYHHSQLGHGTVWLRIPAPRVVDVITRMILVADQRDCWGLWTGDAK